MYNAIRRIRAVTRNELQQLRSRPYSLFRIVVFPVTEVLVYALITRFLVTGSVRIGDATFVVAGSMAWILINEFQRGFTLAFFDLVYEHTLGVLCTMPVRLWEWMSGIAIATCVVIGATATMIVATAIALGVPVGRLGWSLVPTVVVGAILAFTLSLLVICCVLAWGRGASELAWGIGAMLSPLSGAFVPVSQLPPVLQPIAKVLPTTWLFTAMREAWTGGGIPWDAYGIAFAGALTSLTATLWLTRRTLRGFRQRVSVTRFI